MYFFKNEKGVNYPNNLRNKQEGISSTFKMKRKCMKGDGKYCKAFTVVAQSLKKPICFDYW